MKALRREEEEGGRDREGGERGTLLDSPMSKSTEGERQGKVGEVGKEFTVP